jgi:LuxR family maltose regulon positive regulatory protein
VILGVTNWSRGELEAAYAAMAGWVDSMLAIDNLYFAAASTFVLADLREAQGRLHEAVQIYRQSLARAADQEAALRPILSHHHLGLAMLYHEMGAAGSATQAWQKAREVGRQSVLINWPTRWHRALARRKISAGEWAAALELLDEAARQYVPNPVPDTEPIAAVKARIFLRQGRLGAAQAWARAEGWVPMIRSAT